MAFRLIQDFVYPIGTSYKGEAVLSTFQFGTLAGVAAMPIAQNTINELESQSLAEGLHTLRTRVWCDSAPVLETRFFVEFTCCPSEEHSPVPPAVIAAIPFIIKAVVAIVVAVVLYLAIKQIKEIFYSPAGPEVASGMKWVAIGISLTAVGLVIRAIIKALPRRAVEVS